MAEGWFTTQQLSTAIWTFEKDYEVATKYLEEKLKGKTYKKWSWKKFKYIDIEIKSIKDFSYNAPWKIDNALYTSKEWDMWAWNGHYLKYCNQYLEMCKKTADQKILLTQKEFKDFQGYL